MSIETDSVPGADAGKIIGTSSGTTDESLVTLTRTPRDGKAIAESLQLSEIELQNELARLQRAKELDPDTLNQPMTR